MCELPSVLGPYHRAKADGYAPRADLRCHATRSSGLHWADGGAAQQGCARRFHHQDPIAAHRPIAGWDLLQRPGQAEGACFLCRTAPSPPPPVGSCNAKLSSATSSQSWRAQSQIADNGAGKDRIIQFDLTATVILHRQRCRAARAIFSPPKGRSAPASVGQSAAAQAQFSSSARQVAEWHCAQYSASRVAPSIKRTVISAAVLQLSRRRPGSAPPKPDRPVSGPKWRRR